MIPPERGFLATSTPFRRGRPSPSLLQNLLSPVSAQPYTSRRKLQTLRWGNDSGFFSDNAENREPGPLPYLEREAHLYWHKIFRCITVGPKGLTEILNMKKRFFLEGLRARLSARPTPKGRICSKDVYDILNACGRPFGMQVTVPEAQMILSAMRSSRECDSVQRMCRKDSFRVSSVPGGLSPEYERRLFAPSSLKQVSRREDSGVGISFDDDSLSSTSGVGGHSFYKPLVPQEYDILKELNRINSYDTTSLLLSYLSPKDLQAVSSVGRQYRNIVLNDTHANQRRCKYLIEMRLAQENKHVGESKETKEDRVLFLDLANKLAKLPKQPLATESSLQTIHQSFVEVGKTIHRSEVLLKCPSCWYPCRRINGSRFCCTRQFCSYEFCRDCAAPYVDNHKCQKPIQVQDLPQIVVGSQKSRRNLRRL